MEATPHQQQAQDSIIELLKTNDAVVLSGSAGVGKTWLLGQIVKRLSSSGNVYCSAPTHNAVGVLQEKMKDINAIFGTTHAALKMKRKIDKKTGRVSFKPSFIDKFPPLKGIKYFIIDESSMLNEDLYDNAIIHAKNQNCKILFCGDIKQLPPVGENISKVFSQNLPTVELTEIIRQKDGSPIIDLSRNLQTIQSKDSRVNQDGEGYIYSYDRQKVIDTLAYVNGTKELKYIAYTNKEVDAINKDVRLSIYGNPGKLELNESIVMSAPYRDIYVNNQEVKINRLDIKEVNFHFLERQGDGFEKDRTSSVPLKVYCVNGYTKTIVDNGNPNSWMSGGKQEERHEWTDNMYIVHEDSEEVYRQVVKHIKTLAELAEIPWVEFYRFIEQFADFTYSHALTIHKSQGNTYDQCIINIENVNFNRNIEEKEKMLYTAVTRASKLVILYKV